MFYDNLVMEEEWIKGKKAQKSSQRRMFITKIDILRGSQCAE